MTYLIVSIIVFYCLCVFVPRRLSWIEILETTWFGLYFETMCNVFLDLKLDLYGYFNKGVDWIALLPLLGVYPSLNYLLLNFFPAGKGPLRIAVYILAWDAFSVAYESLSIQNGVFYYNGWKWWYSAIVYVPIFLILWWQLRLARFLINRAQARPPE